ncbi:hypothetical protein V8G54_008636 [Vigna mungo]|uniref:Uncharacterized protein n=1 Tax=Vigna mungo TaxID=3915 RepID=A0AAQ3P3V2_VIGMU
MHTNHQICSKIKLSTTKPILHSNKRIRECYVTIFSICKLRVQYICCILQEAATSFSSLCWFFFLISCFSRFLFLFCSSFSWLFFHLFLSTCLCYLCFLIFLFLLFNHYLSLLDNSTTCFFCFSFTLLFFLFCNNES